MDEHKQFVCAMGVVCVFGVWGIVFGVWGLVFGVWGLVCGVWCLVFGVWCLVFGVLGVQAELRRSSPARFAVLQIARTRA